MTDATDNADTTGAAPTPPEAQADGVRRVTETKAGRPIDLAVIDGGAADPNAPAAAQAALPSVMEMTNSFGESVSNVLDGLTHITHMVQAADYCGFEPVYCTWTQRTCFQRTTLVAAPSLVPPLPGDPNPPAPPQIVAQVDDIVPMDERRITTLWSEAIEECFVRVRDKNGVETGLAPAKFNALELQKIAATFEDETEATDKRVGRYAARRVNRTADMCDRFCDVGTEEDGEWWANWFLDEWGAVAPTPEERELVRNLTIRMGCNILDRIYNPGRGLKAWPTLVGGTSLGKSEFVQHLLPLSMETANLHSRTLELKKKPDELVRKVSGKLLCEISELADIEVAQVERVKEFLGGGQKEARLMRENWERNFTMTCAYIGTANTERPVLPPNDLALTARVPVIEVTTSPWGRVDADGNSMDVKDILDENDEALRRRIWRGWKHWYFTRKFNPMAAFTPAELELVRERAAPFTYLDTGTKESLAAARQVLGRLVAAAGVGGDGDATMLFSEGLMAIDLRRVLEEAGYRVHATNAPVKLGQMLRKDDDWFEVSCRDHTKRWACKSLCDRNPSLVAAGSDVEAAWRALGGGGNVPPVPPAPPAAPTAAPVPATASDPALPVAGLESL